MRSGQSGRLPPPSEFSPVRLMGSRSAPATLLSLGRRAGLVLWWALTGQLPRRFRWWRNARAGRLPAAPRPPAILLRNAAPSDIVLPSHPHPEICIIIPSYGQAGYTLRCLASIALAPPTTPFEVLVAEDASGDPDMAALRGIPSIRYLENPSNLGFLLSCNAAAGQTAAEFLLFLNNDTQVQPGWLDALTNLLRRRPDAGAAGAKLIYPDGRLQEAGGIIWADASGWNFGRLDDPSKPVYNYVREADYVSGAALLVRRALFESLGGFDPAYAPAYCEDSDLAFRLREIGYKTLYQPRAVVVHFEGISHGTDLASGLKAHQVTNQARLHARWNDVLQSQHYPNGTQLLRARDRGHGRRVVLVIDHYVPQPDRDAGSRTMLAFLHALRQAGRIVKFWPDNGAYSPSYTETLQDDGIEVVYGPSAGRFETWISVNGEAIDGVLLSRPHVAERYLRLLRRHTNARIAFYGHDLHGARQRRQAAFTGDTALAVTASATEKLERCIWRKSDVVLYPSQEEADEAQALEPEITARAVLPYAFATFGVQRDPPPDPKILFVAGFGHPPNEDAAIWMATDILPRIRASVPGAELQIVGSNPTERVRALAGPGISVSANVSDEVLADFYRQARVAAVPLRFGAGVKLKVVEALAAGLPLVTTPVGAQGCDGIGDVIAIAGDAQGFAYITGRLLTDDSAWRDTSTAQIAHAKRHFSEDALRESLLWASGL